MDIGSEAYESVLLIGLTYSKCIILPCVSVLNKS